MYKIDPKFFDKDGSINYEKAFAAGRLERSRAAYKTFGYIWNGLSKAARSLGRSSGGVTGPLTTRKLRAS
ncbi:MAG: hypothetical protein AAF468_22085 [Pseudomonadota bacterium]